MQEIQISNFMASFYRDITYSFYLVRKIEIIYDAYSFYAACMTINHAGERREFRVYRAM